MHSIASKTMLCIPKPCLTQTRMNAMTSVSVPTVNRTCVTSADKIYRTRSACQQDLSDRNVQELLKNNYADEVVLPVLPSIEIHYREPTDHVVDSSPVYIYKKSTSWTPAAIEHDKAIKKAAARVNPHYIHRPGVIASRNVDKKVLVRTKTARVQCPSTSNTHLTLEINGKKLTYDPRLTLNDRSSNLTKYVIDGRLFLIKDHRYNVIENNKYRCRSATQLNTRVE
jgi:hypothetical protein